MVQDSKGNRFAVVNLVLSLFSVRCEEETGLSAREERQVVRQHPVCLPAARGERFGLGLVM